jgi:alpha-galactosidase/6-phospho-beta-glucosidase family protein
LQNSNDDGQNSNSSSPLELTEEEKKEVERLKALDRQVRAHEQAHLAAAGNLATSGTKFEYKTGPDGKQYAVAGEVEISMREGKNPEETIRIAEQVQRAALAPADPSPQDRRVAADAANKAMQARMELLKEQIEKSSVNISNNADSSETTDQQIEAENVNNDGAISDIATITTQEAAPQIQQNTFAPIFNVPTTPSQQQSNQFADQLFTNPQSSIEVSIADSAQKASINLRGRQEIGKISRGERGIFMGIQFSTFSIQT